jgi:predicted dehydrogenase
MTDFCWAIIGPGAIAHRFADAVNQIPNTRVHAVLGRDATRTASFAAMCAKGAGNAPRVLPDLAALLTDSAIDGVYIATPHSSHAHFAHACLQAGKPVLCEKPLTPNFAQTAALVAQAQQNKVFLMEAMWTRFLPIYGVLREWLTQQAIGPLRAIQSSFCFAADYQPNSRLFDPGLAGGTLLDIGIYNLAITRFILEATPGTCPEPLHMRADAVLAPSGVDRHVAATLVFDGSITSQFVCSFDACADNGLRIFGAHGCIILPHHFWETDSAVLQRKGEPDLVQQAPIRINGFEGEIEEAMRCVRAGLTESPLMPHHESLGLIRWLDALRQQLGVRYPFE